MRQEFKSKHRVDDEGNPAGGEALATGVEICWQDGPLGRGKERQEPNGAFAETVLAIVLDRLNFYEDSKFGCSENALAVSNIECALHWLNARSKLREARGVEGTHQV